jgi:hypothetical protein
MSIIAINGRIGSGKDLIGTIIPMVSKETWEVKKFAGKLKVISSILTGIPIEQFEDQDFKKTYLGDEWITPSYYDTFGMPIVGHRMTVREFLQKIGTEAIRTGLHPDAWVNALMSEYVRPSKWVNRYYDEKNKQGLCGREEVWGDLPNWIITDCRFKNEAAAVKRNNGIIIRVERGENDSTDLHPSETELDNYPFDYVIDNNGTITELTDKIRAILAERRFV